MLFLCCFLLNEIYARVWEYDKNADVGWKLLLKRVPSHFSGTVTFCLFKSILLTKNNRSYFLTYPFSVKKRILKQLIIANGNENLFDTHDQDAIYQMS